MLETHLLIIDPQFDFCHPEGSLTVPGALEDMARVSALIADMEAANTPFAQITVTLDTHSVADISHASAWSLGVSDESPDPFTLVELMDVEAGRFMYRYDNEYGREYIRKLTARGGHHLLFPEHCVLGTPGHAIVEPLRGVLRDHELRAGPGSVNWFVKGRNPRVEEFSAVRAMVPDRNDLTANRNTEKFMSYFRREVPIAVVGEASSHCVMETIYDMLDLGEPAERFIILSDAMSAVPSCEMVGDVFVDDMGERGAAILTVNQFKEQYL